MKNNPYLPLRRSPKRAPIRILQSPPSTIGVCLLLCSTCVTLSASRCENSLIESAFNNNVSLSRSELYDSGKTCPAYSAFNLDIKPAALRASGRRSTPVGRKPNIEGESITENRFKSLLLRHSPPALTNPYSKKHHI